MIHLAFFIPTLDRIGGAESQVLLLAEGLARRGWKVTLMTLSGDALLCTETSSDDPFSCIRQRLAVAGVALHSLGMRKAWVDPRGWHRYLTWAHGNSPHIVHAHLPHAAWFARFMRMLAPVPLVVETIHTTRAISYGSRLLTQLSNWLCNRTTCVSETVAQSVLRTGAIPAGKLTLLSNGIQLGSGWTKRLEPRDELPENSRSFHWLAVGRLAPVKDYPTLLRAFAAVSRRAADLADAAPWLTIAGEGSEQDSLRQLAENLQIASHVHFAGFQRDVHPLLAAADAFVLSSLWEGLPIGILEAQAAGLPVVATNGPGTADALIDGQTGFLTPVGRVDLLAEVMFKVMAMPRCQRNRMGKMGRNFVAAAYSLDVVLDQWENLYRELLEQQPQPSRRAHEKLRRRGPGEISIASSGSGFVPGGADPRAGIRRSANEQLPARPK